MTAEEAIKTIEVAMAEVEWNYPMDYAVAFEMAIAALHAQQEVEKNEPLTLDELREMAGKPAWCAEYQCYGIVEIETVGCWANKPFLVGSWHDPMYGAETDFKYDIKKRGLTLYRRKPKEEHL